MGVTGTNMSSEHRIQIICTDPELTREYIHEIQNADESFHVRPIAWLAEAHQVRAEASVFLLDESGVDGQSQQTLESAIDRLVEVAPVIVVAAPERQSELSFLLGSGAADFVARTGNFVPVAVGLVERRIRLAKAGAVCRSGSAREEWANDFGEILRHEVNNPLTGILGNAEMLLARRDRLPASAIERLETIAHLAVRLRETVRRLSSAAELRQAGSSFGKVQADPHP
jgi:signal transduction histidine kinase